MATMLPANRLQPFKLDIRNHTTGVVRGAEKTDDFYYASIRFNEIKDGFERGLLPKMAGFTLTVIDINGNAIMSETFPAKL